MSQADEFLCTLTPEDTDRRREQHRRLTAHLRACHHDPRRAVLTFAPQACAEVQEFVRDESACCSFFGFDVQTGDDAVQLRVTAPHGAEGMLDALIATLDPAPAGETSDPRSVTR